MSRGVSRKKIEALVNFARVPRSYSEIANLHLPGFGKTRQSIFQRCRKLKVRRQSHGGVCGIDFFSLPDWWQVAIIRHFMCKPRTKYISQRSFELILFAAACADQRFALEWKKREEYLNRVHENIFKIISACGEKRRV